MTTTTTEAGKPTNGVNGCDLEKISMTLEKVDLVLDNFGPYATVEEHSTQKVECLLKTQFQQKIIGHQPKTTFRKNLPNQMKFIVLP